MEQWLILSNIVNFVQYNRHLKNYYDLEKLKGEYLHMFEGIQSEVKSTTRFDENSDLSTAY